MNKEEYNPSFDLYNDGDDLTAFVAALTCDTEEEAEKLLTWAQTVQVQYHLIQNALLGQMTIGWNGTEATFQVTEEGKKRVEELIKPDWPTIITDQEAKP